jgi:signal transduction histidine kinase
MVVAIVATLSAAGLVLFLQHRAISTLGSQTRVILRQISELTAADVATELRRILDGPVFDTLTAVNHPELRQARLDLVAERYILGLRAYPHVDRFLLWHASTETRAPGEVLFFGRDGQFRRDPAFGRAVLDLARRHAPAQQIYLAAEGVGPDQRAQVFLRLFWTDARRVEFFAILGFVVDPTHMRQQLFAAIDGARLASVLARRGGTPLRLRVTDENGTAVYGGNAPLEDSGRVEFPMLFYPADEIQSRLAARLEPRLWTIEVAPPPGSTGTAGVLQRYGPTAASVLLMLVALALTVQAHRRSTELAAMQADFVAHVTHQLKTPLSLLSTATETLQMARIRSPERFEEYLSTIHAEAGRLSLLVQRVLEFSRIQQQRSYEFETVDLYPLVRETVGALANSTSHQQFTFEVEQDGSDPAVRADPAALEQILVNLLDNAVKYSDTLKHIVVRVTSTRREAIVEVIDRGIGIAPREQARIFDRFYRTPDSSHRPGFGLGLPLVKELAHAHGGRVEVSSVHGRGSTFRVRLPRLALAAGAVHGERRLEHPETP